MIYLKTWLDTHYAVINQSKQYVCVFSSYYISRKCFTAYSITTSKRKSRIWHHSRKWYIKDWSYFRNVIQNENKSIQKDMNSWVLYSICVYCIQRFIHFNGYDMFCPFLITWHILTISCNKVIHSFWIISCCIFWTKNIRGYYSLRTRNGYTLWWLLVSIYSDILNYMVVYSKTVFL